MSYNTLVSVADLAAHLDDPHWVVCDCRHDLADYEAGRSAYAQSHIPGARFLHLDEDLSGPKTGVNGRHPLPHPITLTLRLGALGIDNGKQIIAYDASGGSYAARLWWMLRWVGHHGVAVLHHASVLTAIRQWSATVMDTVAKLPFSAVSSCPVTESPHTC